MGSSSRVDRSVLRGIKWGAADLVLGRFLNSEE
jgi:hypothetical protein